MKPAEPGAPRGWSDRINPVLVKELRAMLRGRFLPVLLLCAVGLVMAVTLWIMFWTHLEEGERRGAALFLGVHWTAHILISVFPPMWAFTSLGQEFEEGTLDLLAIARLSSWGVVVGKFFAAVVQSAVILCAVSPFAFFAFLLGGLDALFVASILPSMLVSSGTSIALALAVSCLTRVRWARTLLLTALFLWLAWEHGQMIMFFGNLSGIGAQIASGWSYLWMLPNLTMNVLECGLLLAFAGGRLAHAEESRSTPMRAWCLVLVVTTIVGSLLALLLGADGTTVAFYVSRSWLLALGVFFLSATEPDALPRARAGDPRPGRLTRWGQVLFVSGGGRGTLFGLVLLTLATALTVTLPHFVSSLAVSPWILDVFVVAALPCACILLPAGLLAKRNSSAAFTLRQRVGIVLGGLALWFAGEIVDLLTGRDAGTAGVFGVLHTTDGFGVTLSLGETQRWALLVFALAGIAVNVPRMLRGAREVLVRDAAAVGGHPGALDAPPRT